jgi:phosphatidylserine/phosphatidylglycerophosphate/cardiolipin synthase-like enzyme
MLLERDLIGPTQSQSIIDLLQSLLVLELIKPSKTIWVGSAWISDIQLFDNRGLQYRSLEPDWPADMISLSKVLLALAKRGTKLIILTRNDEVNQNFLNKIRANKTKDMSIEIILRNEFHEKGLLSDSYEITGSMNFTFNGIMINDERVIYRCDKNKIAERQIVMWNKYGDELNDK